MAGPTPAGIQNNYIVDAASSTSYAIPHPARTTTGAQLLLISRRAKTGATLAQQSAAGFTWLKAWVPQTGERFDMFTRTVAAGEPAAFNIQTFTLGGPQEGLIAAYTGALPITAADIEYAINQSGTALTTPVFTTTGGDHRVAAIFNVHAGGVSSVPTAGWTDRLVYGERRFYFGDRTLATAITGGSITANLTASSPLNSVARVILRPQNRAPAAPILLEPMSGDVRAMNEAGSTIAWQFSDPDQPADAQTAIRLKRRTNVAGSTPSWWTGTTWAASQTDVTSTSEAVSFPAGAWPTNGGYLIAVATRDQSDAWGSYSDESLVTVATRPSVAFASPASLEVLDSTNVPMFTWASDLPAGAQVTFHVRVFNRADTSLGGVTGFNPRTAGGSVADSGRVLSSSTSWTSNKPLDNTQSYVAYLWVEAAGRLTSNTASVEFTVAITPPSPPATTLTVAGDSVSDGEDVTRGHVDIVALGENLLSAQDANYTEDNTVGTAVGVLNVESITVTSAHTREGSTFALQVTPLTPGQPMEIMIGPYTAGADFVSGTAASYPATTATSFKTGIRDADSATVVYGAPVVENSSVGTPPPPPPPPTTHAIYYSPNQDRTGAAPLAGSTITGPVHIFDPSPDPNVLEQDWYIDDVVVNTPPVVSNGGPDYFGPSGHIKVGDTVVLPVVVVDPDFGDTVTLLTTSVTGFTVGGPVTVTNATTDHPSFVASHGAGSYTFWTDATDSRGATTRATVVVHVEA